MLDDNSNAVDKSVEDEDERPFPVSDVWAEVSELQFDGRRFADHSIEFDVLPELIQFQGMVTDLAKELYKREHHRQRVPSGFELNTKLRFKRLGEGSTIVPVEARSEATDTIFGVIPSQYVARAIQLLHQTIRSQNVGTDIPPEMPRDQIIPQLCKWGTTLREDEWIGVGGARLGEKAASPQDAKFTRNTKQKLRKYLDLVFEDTITLYGEVRMVDRDNFRAEVRLPDQSRVNVRFQKLYESTFLRALNQEIPVSIKGLAILSNIDGFVQRMTSVTDITPVGNAESSKRVGAWLDEHRADIDWSNVADSTHIDNVLYGG